MGSVLCKLHEQTYAQRMFDSAHIISIVNVLWELSNQLRSMCAAGRCSWMPHDCTTMYVVFGNIMLVCRWSPTRQRNAQRASVEHDSIRSWGRTLCMWCAKHTHTRTHPECVYGQITHTAHNTHNTFYGMRQTVRKPPRSCPNAVRNATHTRKTIEVVDVVEMLWPNTKRRQKSDLGACCVVTFGLNEMSGQRCSHVNEHDSKIGQRTVWQDGNSPPTR